jgi:hypothetical protein
MYYHWRSSYQGSDSINRFNPDKFLCLSKAKIWTSNIICGCPPFLSVQRVKARRDCSFLLILVELLTINLNFHNSYNILMT